MAEKDTTVVVRTKRKAKAKRKGAAARKATKAAPAPPPADAPGDGGSDVPADDPDDVERGQWGSKIGFVFAAVGSAVGFGSVARFPFMTADNGGAAFVLIYAGLMILVGIPMMMSEFSIGRAGRLNPVGAMRKLRGRSKTKWRFAGLYFVLTATFFLSWYAVTGGWVLRYIFASATGAYFDDPATYFANVQQGPGTLIFFAITMVLTIFIVTKGVQGGIEKLNLILIPSLFAIILGLTVYAATLDNVSDGYRFYLQPEWGEVTPTTIKAAVAQAFFSLSLGQGAMLTYSSYLSRKQNLASNAVMISSSTLVFAIIAGLMVFPLLSTFGLLGQATPGIGLIFVPLPAAFAEIGGALGMFVGTAFFIGTFFAVFTSAVSLIEPSVSFLHDELGISRTKAAILMGEIIYGMGIIAALNIDILNLEAGAGTDAAVLGGGLIVALFVGYVMKDKAREEMDMGAGRLKFGSYAYPIAKYAMPFVLAVLAIIALFGNPAIFGLDEGQGFIDQLMDYLNGT